MVSTRKAASQAAAMMVTTSRSSKVSARPFKEVARTKDGERPAITTAATTATAAGPSQTGGAVPHSQADKRHASKCVVCDAKIVSNGSTSTAPESPRCTFSG